MQVFILFSLSDSEVETGESFRGIFTDKALAVAACRELFHNEDLGRYGGKAWVNEVTTNETTPDYVVVFQVNEDGSEDVDGFRTGKYCETV